MDGITKFYICISCLSVVAIFAIFFTTFDLPVFEVICTIAKKLKGIGGEKPGEADIDEEIKRKWEENKAKDSSG